MVPESVLGQRRLLLGGFVAAVAALTELAALRPGDVVVVDDVLAPPSLRTIIDELDFAYWWPTEIGWRQASGAFKRGVSLGRRIESTSEVWFGEELRRAIALLDERICPALGVTRHHLELWQAARYEAGGYPQIAVGYSRGGTPRPARLRRGGRVTVDRPCRS